MKRAKMALVRFRLLVMLHPSIFTVHERIVAGLDVHGNNFICVTLDIKHKELLLYYNDN